MHLKGNPSRKIIVCLPNELLKKIDKLSSKYKNRSELIRQAIELLIVSHSRKNIENELKEGFKLLKHINGGFADKSVVFEKEALKE